MRSESLKTFGRLALPVLFAVFLFEGMSVLSGFFAGEPNVPLPWSWYTLLQQGFSGAVGLALLCLGLGYLFFCGVIKAGVWRWGAFCGLGSIKTGTVIVPV